MTTSRLACLLLPLFFTHIAHAAECGKAVSAEAVHKLPASVTLGDLSGKYGDACPGDGPVSWYRSAAGKQIWFYWKRTAQAATAGGKSNAILMATEVNAADFDEQKIIWPAELVGKDIPSIILNEFGPQQSK